jgi:hypothetical protein
MIDAKKLILKAVQEAERIRTAGADSLMGIACRAVDAEGKASLKGISRTLGLHPSVVIAITVTADVANSTDARRELGLALFERLQLHTHPPLLTEQGRVGLASWCIERLLPMKEALDGDLVEETLAASKHLLETGASPRMGAVMELQSRAEKLQRLEVVGVAAGRSGSKEKLGITDEQRFQRHAAQAIRALLEGLKEQGKNPHLCTTVAGEVARALEAGLGFAASAGFTLELAQHIEEELPREHLRRPPQN